MIKIGLLGATGYTGLELVRILAHHPQVEIAALTSEKFAGKLFSQAFPSFQGICDLPLEPLQTSKIAKRVNFILSCLPHQKAMAVIPEFLGKGCKVVDLSADFRFDSPKVYEEWYEKHAAPALLKEKVYGLPELYRNEIKKASLVGNPGCYPTATLLGLIPLLEGNLVQTEGIICDAKSGISGAGRSVALESLFSEVNESVIAYKVTAHRHTPEIEQELSKIAGQEVKLTFVPHLVPMDRGILATIYARSLRKIDNKTLTQLFQKRYAREPFVQVCPEGLLPSTKWVRGTNSCAIGVQINPRTGQIIVVSVIDNLVKGASGQAVQNMNLMCGFPEKTALENSPLQP
ncbi:MAG: N-acetyl-gamma-glutamyl-phosphate reductase [Deltaproteobacteria bacterium]|nr:N-acetyl-gamma-glutamyl-phosphate reductase [Deltaproteobacteria bacterium]